MKNTLKAGLVLLIVITAGPVMAYSHNNQVREIQQMLAQCGFDPGPVDGNWGRQTARAAAEYIRAHGALADNARWTEPSDTDRRTSLIAQIGTHLEKSAQPCPAPGSEIWECSTVLSRGNPEILLAADHSTETGQVKLGTIPVIGTLFAVEGLERAWRWRRSSEKGYAFTIGPHGAFGLSGFYFDFSHAADENGMVKSQAHYSCEQVARP
ncbi:MAG: peptidoglycan-binding protein [Rhodobacteraceae bacterium]|nr:peptidoglycan-binding protein [Paracoccaceae bacterium]